MERWPLVRDLSEGRDRRSRALASFRATGLLRVAAAYRETHADAGAVVGALADELLALARWLALADVAVADRGDLARGLAARLDA